MTTLTADQITDIRLVTGADDSTIISDAVIQAQYNLAEVDAADDDFTLPYTYVYVLRRLMGYQRTKPDWETDHGDRVTRSQITTNTEKWLAYWEGKAGLVGGGVLSSGVIQMGLDEDEET